MNFSQALVNNPAMSKSVSIQILNSSLRVIPAHLLQESQEQSILQAYQDWHSAQISQNEAGIAEIKQSTCQMAEADYMARLAQLESGKGAFKNP